VRSEALHRAFELMMCDRDDLAALIARENGKPQKDIGRELQLTRCKVGRLLD
jgi:acyl-CoA reductase-like NAD-dependent aldehyde dehydrogenase